MHAWLETYKPAASPRTHLFMAAFTWSVVGAGMLIFGVRWLSNPWWGVFLLPVAIMIGLLKSRYVLDLTTHRIAHRIIHRSDRRCIGGFLSWKMWCLVMVMMISGRLLRTSGIPMPYVGLLYSAVGIALLFSSRHVWSHWKKVKR